jgi:hypothetical protein
MPTRNVQGPPGLAPLVVIFLGTGITSTECRHLEVDDLNVDGLRLDVYVKELGARASRRVALDSLRTRRLARASELGEHRHVAGFHQGRQ